MIEPRTLEEHAELGRYMLMVWMAAPSFFFGEHSFGCRMTQG